MKTIKILNKPLFVEFGKGQNVTFWDGKKYHKAHIRNVRINPVEDTVEYQIFYRRDPNAKGFDKTTISDHQIKESINFKNNTTQNTAV